MAIKTLRKNYKDEIIVFSEEKIKDERTIITKNQKNAKHLKTTAGKYINFEKYQNVMYLDADVLIPGNINEIFNLSEINKIFTTKEFNHILYTSPSSRFLWRNEKEIELAKKIPASNAGFFMTTSQNIQEFCENWTKNLNEKNNLRNNNMNCIVDQPSFNATLVEYHLNSNVKPTFIPDNLYSFNGKNLDNVCFSHFTHKKNNIEEIFKKIMKNAIKSP